MTTHPPTPHEIRAFGPYLARTTPEERAALMDAPYGQWETEAEKLKRRVYMREYMRKRRKEQKELTES